jgi:conserved oligomeric Golgi complex subunit 4
VFYILKFVLSRLSSTGSVKTVERTLKLLWEIMERDYAGVIKKKLDDVYRTTGSIGPGSRGEKGERESRSAFIVRTFPFSVNNR